jgi:hypothetical protein
MCISERVSWIALVSGLILIIASIVYIKDRRYLPLALTWCFILLMQLADGLVWHYGCNDIGLKASRMALVFNVMQPVVLYLMYIALYPREGPLTYKEIIATVLVACWIGYVIFSIKGDYGCIKTETCSNLDYKWWEKDLNGTFYTFVIIVLALLLIKPLKFGIAVSVYTLLALLISILYYKCGSASMWCLFVVTAPLFFILFWKMFNGVKENPL